MRYLLILLPCLMLSSQTPLSAQTPAPAKKAAPAATKPTPSVMLRNFKESGMASAPVQIEIYTDYECPACRDLYLTVLPSLNREYVNTGKVKLLHRDFPLQQHLYSKKATAYANAAGSIGKYDLVAQQLFQTQPEWAQSGNVDAVVAKVLAGADLEKVRGMAKGEVLDDSVAADVAMGEKDNLRQTPTIVIIAKGKREVISGGMPYSILKSYIDKKLAQ